MTNPLAIPCPRPPVLLSSRRPPLPLPSHLLPADLWAVKKLLGIVLSFLLPSLAPADMLARALGMAGALLSAPPPTEEFDEAHFGEKQLELVRETGLDFPEGARGLRLFCDYRCAFDCSYAARISLPGDAAAAIAAQLEKLPAKHENVSNLRTSELDWWPQDDAPRRLERYFEWKAGLVWAFLLDEEDATVLYLYWFTV